MFRFAFRRSIVAVSFFLTLQGIGFSEQGKEDIVIGKRYSFHSDLLQETRTIELYVPGDFADSDQRYPVLVVLDGGWFFRYCVSVVDMMSPNHFPRMIIVGLPNTDRTRDLAPLNKHPDGMEAGTRLFLRFLKLELIPHIEKKYRALPYRILCGHSMAGFFSLYTLVEECDLFNAYIATSPSFRAPEKMQLMREKLRKCDPEKLSGRYLYVSGGGNEPEALHKAIQEFDVALDGRLGNQLKHHFDIFEDEGHVPTKGFYQGLRDLFPDWIPKLDFFLKGSLDDLKKHYAALSKAYGFSVTPPAAIINSVGRRMLREEKWAEAAEVYQTYVSFYPSSVFGFLSLAEAYQKADKVDQAIEAVEKALRIEKDHERALKMLQELNTPLKR